MKTKIIATVLALSVILMTFSACGMTTSSQTTKPTAVQTAQSEQNIDQSEAANVIKNMIRMDYAKYKIDLINGNLEYKGSEYYQFLISDSEISIEPSIIVSKNNGVIFCYYPDNTITEVYQDGVFKSKC